MTEGTKLMIPRKGLGAYQTSNEPMIFLVFPSQKNKSQSKQHLVFISTMLVPSFMCFITVYYTHVYIYLYNP
jgi:hypothetical protein